MKVCVHIFKLGDVEDPEIYAADPIWQWQQTEQGKWVMENSLEQPYYTSRVDNTHWGYSFAIWANLSDEHASYFLLKYGKFS